MPIVSEESEVDIEVESIEESSEEENFGEQDDDEEIGEDELEDSDNEDRDANGSQSIGVGRAGPLKIKLRFGGQSFATTQTGSASRFAHAKDEDVEWEDSHSADLEYEAHAARPSSGRKLTARQAVLASAVTASSLHTATTSSRKARFTPSEVALRNEENARKRKNVVEKKLKDEQAETINRLLKGQSRAKLKRNTAAQPGEGIELDVGDAATAPATTIPMYRWVSTSRKTDAVAASISFSIPESFLPATDGETVTPPRLSEVSITSRCAVEGCEERRKYRAVGKPWGIGACGLEHLKVLTGVTQLSVTHIEEFVANSGHKKPPLVNGYRKAAERAKDHRQIAPENLHKCGGGEEEKEEEEEVFPTDNKE
ncbi:hypothetical protein B0H13DRAFT_2650116, partial [Mycena leptocephala]